MKNLIKFLDETAQEELFKIRDEAQGIIKNIDETPEEITFKELKAIADQIDEIAYNLGEKIGQAIKESEV